MIALDDPEAPEPRQGALFEFSTGESAVESGSAVVQNRGSQDGANAPAVNRGGRGRRRSAHCPRVHNSGSSPGLSASAAARVGALGSLAYRVEEQA